MTASGPAPTLRIAQVAPPGIPCPPNGYGASELVASNLTEELVDRGHEVTLFAHPDSITRAELVSFPQVYDLPDATWREVAHTSLALELVGEFDIIHNHCIAPGPALVRLATSASLTTLHYLRPLVHTFASAPYVAVSDAQARRLRRDLNIVGVAHNGIDMDSFPVVQDKSEFLLFLGRIDPKKGVHLAIEAARRVDMPLVIAASAPTKDNRAYFEQQVKPHLGGTIQWIGHADTREKIELLGHARCVLMPQQWEEPFGLVAVEALASGTPVVAMRRGALPEIIPHGEAGYIVDTVDQMVEALGCIGGIAPLRCRAAVESRFSRAAMADAYLSIYHHLLNLRTGPLLRPLDAVPLAEGAS